MKDQPDLDRIAEESLGQRHASPPPEAVREKERMSPEETVQRLAKSAGAQASTSEKTAESMGERVGDAYSDGTKLASDKTSVRHAAQSSHWFDEQPFLTVLAAFGLGYIAGVLTHRRASGATP
jgi:ElaB/YqjD/DUF883 family membrane-anchored ribosome-binding protein